MAVISLALGIGANTGIFSLVNVVLLLTLPVRDPEELVVFTISTADRFGGSAIGQEQYRHIRDKNTVLQGFAAFTGDPMTVSGNGNAEFTVGQRRFGGDPGMIGGNIQINGQPVTVLGVIPKEFISFEEGAQTDIINAAEFGRQLWTVDLR